MTDVFSKEEVIAVRAKRNLMLGVWFGLLALFLAIVITLIVVDMYLVGILRNRDHTIWMAVVSILLAIIFGCYSLFFFSIKFRLTRKYCRMLRDIERGLKDETEAKFVGYDENISMKDGVYFYSMVLDAKPLKREDITERKLLIEHTMPKIELEEGARLKIVSHANILVSYEILDNVNKAHNIDNEKTL